MMPEYRIQLYKAGIGIQKAIQAATIFDIETAIIELEEVLKLKTTAQYTYIKLIQYYKKLKYYDDCVRVAKIALDVFEEENIRRREMQIKFHPEYANAIYEAWENNHEIIINDNNRKQRFCLFNPYPIKRYLNVIEKWG